ncbi:VOC family protein [Streptomyces sp. NPDC058284]|uniref:VOC family protein n=1 Tax=unclassified Streptomyces TaxID=2593676 RepID=UPI003658C6B2
MPLAAFRAVVLDCPDPHALAEFYAKIVGGTPVPDPADEEAWVGIEGHGGPPIAFQKAPGHRPPQWPAPDGGQQFHLDFTVDDMDAVEKEILTFGATVLDAADRDRSWRVYADPAGHPFCLCAS